MKNLFITLTVFLCASFFIASCKKSDLVSDDPLFQSENKFTTTVQANITGRIVDQNDEPVNGATVIAGSARVSTDINGEFLLTEVNIPANAGLIKVIKAGFFTGYRTIPVNSSSTKYTTIQLIPKLVSGNFSAASGGLINANNGGTIEFSSNSIINESTGAAYNGNVKVSAFFLNPADAAFQEYMPGDLRGIDANNNVKGLQSFGMMVVELEGTSGEKLQVAPGKTATLQYPIAAALRAQATPTIPFWHFDEVQGIWKEEGSGTKQGDNYIAKVSHFSFWNADMPESVVDIEAAFRDKHGNGLAYAKVSFTRTNGDTRSGYTDASGNLYATVPAGETMIMKVEDNCHSALFTQQVGQFSKNINLGQIIVPVSSANLNISGKAITCGGAPVKDGILEVTLDGRLHRAIVSNGNFNINITRCDNNATDAVIRVFDMSSAMLSDAMHMSVTAGNADAGQISACSIKSDQFISLNLNGEAYLWEVNDNMNLMINGISGQSNTFIESSKDGGFQTLVTGFSGATTAGTYNSNQFEFYPTIESETAYTQGASPLSVTITSYGANDEYVSGSFHGDVMRRGATDNKLFPVHGEFRLRRH